MARETRTTPTGLRPGCSPAAVAHVLMEPENARSAAALTVSLCPGSVVNGSGLAGQIGLDALHGLRAAGRTLLACCAAMGVPYRFQHGTRIFQLCRPVWQRWLRDPGLAGALDRGLKPTPR